MRLFRTPQPEPGDGGRVAATARRVSLRRLALVTAVAALLATALGMLNLSSAFASDAASGEGTMTVTTPASGTVVAGSTNNQLVFTFKASSGPYNSGSKLEMTIPSGWTDPTGITTVATPAGSNGCPSASNPPNIASGSGGSWTVTVTMQCNNNDQLTITYGTSSSKVTAPTVAGTAQFTTRTAQNANGTLGTLTNISAQPSVTVAAGSASKLAFIQGPTDVAVATAMSPSVTVQVQDQFGNSVSTPSPFVSITLAVSSGTITSGGGPVNTNSSGLATFPVRINTAAAGLTLTASSSGLNSSPASSSFTVFVPVSNSSAALTDFATDGTGAGVKSVSYYSCIGYSGACSSSNGTLLGTSTNAAGNFPVTWPNQVNGTYRVVAVSSDNVNNSSTSTASTPVKITNP